MYGEIINICASATKQTPALIDLSKKSFFYPFELVYLLLFVTDLMEKGMPANLIMPTDRSAQTYLKYMKLAERLRGDPVTEPDRFSSGTTLGGGDIFRIDKQVEEDLADHYARMFNKWLANSRSQLNNVAAEELTEIFAEIVSNFDDHARSDVGYFAGQYYPKSCRFHMAIGDLGRGIRAALGATTKFAYLKGLPEERAVLEALKGGASCRPGQSGGMGLKMICDAVDKYGGYLYIQSGEATVLKNAGEAPWGWSWTPLLRGVRLEVVLNG